MKRVLLIPLLLTAGAHAEPLNYNVVSLEAEAHREVPNDQMRANLFAEHGDADPARLASLINRQMNDAKKLAALYPSIRFASGDNQTYPVYDNKNRLTGWRSRAEVRLECQDFKLCSELIGRLQASLQLGSWEFGIAPETRRKIENELTAEAIAAFKGKAELVSKALNAPAYKLVTLNFNSSVPYTPRLRMAKADMAMAAAAPPMVEAGTGSVAVNVSGAIQLQER